MSVTRDIHQISIDTSLPKQERILNFLSQIENPREFEDGGIKVVLKYADTNETLTDRLITYANCMNVNS